MAATLCSLGKPLHARFSFSCPGKPERSGGRSSPSSQSSGPPAPSLRGRSDGGRWAGTGDVRTPPPDVRGGGGAFFGAQAAAHLPSTGAPPSRAPGRGYLTGDSAPGSRSREKRAGGSGRGTGSGGTSWPGGWSAEAPHGDLEVDARSFHRRPG